MYGLKDEKRNICKNHRRRGLRFLFLLIGPALLMFLPASIYGASAKKANCAITVKHVNTWKQGSDTYCQMSVKINNKESRAISSWEMKLNYNKSYKLVNGWCAKYSNSGKTMIIKPESYNKWIKAKGSTEVGFIVKCSGVINYNTASLSVKMGNTNYTYDQKRSGYKATPTPTPKPSSKTPLQQNGRLKVSGTKLVNEKGKTVVLKGVSTHGINWYPEYINSSAFKTLRDQWGVQCIRLAMYTEEYNGYCSGGSQKNLKTLIDQGVKCAADLGMYVIIDWHILNDGNPQNHQKEAVAFFKEMSDKYKNYKNVIYEICNEPNGGTQWNQIKSYAETVIKTIRADDKNNIILVGTPTWSQDVDLVAENPIKGYSNLMYTFHFYSATHGEAFRQKVQTAQKKGLPVFVSEFGISESTGNGSVDKGEGDKWISFLKKNNISYVCWNLSNKNESCALLKSTCKKTGGFSDSDLSTAGKWFKSV